MALAVLAVPAVLEVLEVLKTTVRCLGPNSAIFSDQYAVLGFWNAEKKNRVTINASLVDSSSPLFLCWSNHELRGLVSMYTRKKSVCRFE
jgi:hypothetical protein